LSTRSYLSIGDVLTLLREEFPDITISKIRFLESQGLVSPQRSPSGYRKFFDEDVERLRYVLVQQREHFLPLKVIRDRLNGVEVDEDLEVHGAPVPAPALVTAAADPPAHPPPAEPSKAREPTVADVVAALQEGPRIHAESPQAVASAPTPAPKVTAAAEPTIVGETMTLEELSKETGLTEVELSSLVEFGIIHPVSVGGLSCFDANAAKIARFATGFLALGVEPRHLRLFRNAVDREMGLVEQLVTPLLRQRNPESRSRATAMADELATLGRDLRAAMMEREIAAFLGR